MFRHTSATLAITSAFLLSCSATAVPINIGFEGITTGVIAVNAENPLDIQNDPDITLTSDGGIVIADAVAATQAGYARSGSTMFYQTTNSLAKFSSDATFTLKSFQADLWHDSFTHGNMVQIIGANIFGGDFRHTVFLDFEPGFETFLLPDHWTDLGAIFFANTWGRIAYDNILIDSSAVSASLPAPGPMALLGFGLIALGICRKRIA